MRCKPMVWGMVLAGVFGLSAPGCLWFSQDDEDEGRFCASPMEGGTYCVSSSSGPAAAWDEAKAAGTEPIQMWAEWPKNVELEEVVASPTLLKWWLDDVRTVLDYLRVTQRNAESYHASLSGELGKTLDRAHSVQNGLMWDKFEGPKRRIRNLLPIQGAQEVDLLKAQLAADKQTMGDVLALVQQAKVAGAPFASQYKQLVDDFLAYRATESAETLTYTKWSHEVSGAGIAELASIENGIVDMAHSASAKPNDLLMAGMKLTAEILQFETTSREAIMPHADYMSRHGAPLPDLSSGALRSIHALLGYAQQRVTRSDATAKSLLLGSDMRRRALELLANSPAPARATVANTLLGKASTNFDTAAHVRVNALATKTMSVKLGLPYLASRYDEHAALLQMAPLCNATSSSWREAGCVSLRPKFKEASQYLKVTLPAEISQGLSAMKNQGGDPLAIEKVEQKLKSGDIKGAALAHDALLSSLEGT